MKASLLAKACLAAAFLCTVNSVQAGIIILKNGKKIECVGPFEVSGRQLIYTDTKGKKFQLPTSIVDMKRSKSEHYVKSDKDKEPGEVLFSTGMGVVREEKEEIGLYEIAKRSNNGAKPELSNTQLKNGDLLRTRYKHSTSEGTGWDKAHYEAVCYAVRLGSTHKLDRLIHQGRTSADGNIYESLRKGREGMIDYPLLLAVRKKDIPMTKHLLTKYNVRPNVSDPSGNTALHMIAGVREDSATVNMMTLLIDNRADVNRQNLKGETPLAFAIRSGNTITAKELLKAGAHNRDMIIDGIPALNHTITQGNYAMFRLIERETTNLTELVLGKNDPLMLSIKSNQPEMLEILAGKIDRVRLSKKRIENLLAQAMSLPSTNTAEMVIYLFSIEDKDLFNRLLVDAVYTDSADKIKFLVKVGADPDSKGLRNEPLLVEASRKSYVNAVRGLLDSGADPLAKSQKGLSALAEVDGKNRTLIKQLLRKATR